jgi:hypothetical protein
MAKVQATDITSRQSATRIGQSTAFGADCAYRRGAPATIRTMPRCSTSCSKWAPDEAVRYRILVDNPEELYGFSLSGWPPPWRVFADRGDAGLGIGELQDRVAAAAKACVKSLSGRVLTAPSGGAADCDLHGEAGRRVFVGRGVED